MELQIEEVIDENIMNRRNYKKADLGLKEYTQRYKDSQKSLYETTRDYRQCRLTVKDLTSKLKVAE